MPIPAAAVEAMEANPATRSLVEHLGGWAFKNPTRGALTGLGISAIENQTLNKDADPDLKGINLGLGAAMGGLGGYGVAAKNFNPIATALGTWSGKQMALFGLRRGDDFIRLQEPVAKLNLQTAQLGNDTAKLVADRAKGISPSDMAMMGISGAAIAGAGGLGYKLWKDNQPKPRQAPKLTVTLPSRNKDEGTTAVEMPMDTIDLSKRLYQQLRRDTHRELRTETRENTMHRSKAARVADLVKLAFAF